MISSYFFHIEKYFNKTIINDPNNFDYNFNLQQYIKRNNRIKIITKFTKKKEFLWRILQRNKITRKFYVLIIYIQSHILYNFLKIFNHHMTSTYWLILIFNLHPFLSVFINLSLLRISTNIIQLYSTIFTYDEKKNIPKRNHSNYLFQGNIIVTNENLFIFLQCFRFPRTYSFRQILKTSNIATELDSIPINAEMTFKVRIEWRISKGQWMKNRVTEMFE